MKSIEILLEAKYYIKHHLLTSVHLILIDFILIDSVFCQIYYSYFPNETRGSHTRSES